MTTIPLFLAAVSASSSEPSLPTTWPAAFALVGLAACVALIVGCMVTERWPWGRG